MVNDKKWAMILGASSGFGGATALELARCGFNIFGVHLDRRSTIENAEQIQKSIREQGREAVFFNANAADPVKQLEIAHQVRSKIGVKGSIKVLMHSLAFGTLRPLSASVEGEGITQKQLDMTLDVMANSLVYWVQTLVRGNLLGHGSRVFAMTSAGSTRVWPSYGPVSGAKAALESHVRQLAYELASLGITVNAIRAGVTDTPALRKIPGNDVLLSGAKSRNPSGRLTTPTDVANAIVLLSDERSYWITGNVIGVDGGEDIVG